ncbi:F-box/kelch-repeat protein At3g23880-like [Prosopis cineraria]|uniref:F-box/kelch-repeat protein At3g23880-like n=1 Tax=Prosopis cineraria TaxID=364024 RepID=UPI00240EB3EA|nr:F-box/kelch-repeat protein At3g23880-like [Prosopis cineraria]XP_054795260.1 F-box/kelch-repeat protein At3g23880-like [Prosopis cineraria]
MRRPAVHGDTPFLPEEIVTNILKRLPVKSLIRFQCVCKRWKNLFKTPSFIAEHLLYPTHQNPSLLIIHNSSTCKPLHLRLLDCEMHVREVQNAPLIGSLPDVGIIGSSNGLLCVALDQSLFLCNSLLLWNPAIGEVRQIPRSRTVEFPMWECIVGFGFSPIVNDYKIVKIYDGPGCDDAISVVEVYSLSTGLWKEIEFGSLEGVSLFHGTGTANGAIFWWGLRRGVEEQGEDDTDLIVSFDIEMEVFVLIPWPPLSDRDNSTVKFAVYEDKFAALSLSNIGTFPDYLYSSIDLWVLEECTGSPTERWCWTKKYARNHCPSMLKLGALWRNEIVCIDFGMPRLTNESERETENDGRKAGMYLLNMTTNEFKMFAIPGCGNDCRVLNHVESLVPVWNIHFEEH